jgi:limonene-1,2-epoxide hydrolase
VNLRPASIVENFLNAWAIPRGWRSAIVDYFTSDCVYENVGLSKTTGPGQAIAFVDAFNTKMPFETMTVRLHHVIELGNIVMTERIDSFHAGDGAVIFALPVMGVFELIDGKIAAWRDYFDASGFKIEG